MDIGSGYPADPLTKRFVQGVIHRRALGGANFYLGMSHLEPPLDYVRYSWSTLNPEAVVEKIVRLDPLVNLIQPSGAEINHAGQAFALQSNDVADELPKQDVKFISNHPNLKLPRKNVVTFSQKRRVHVETEQEKRKAQPRKKVLMELSEDLKKRFEAILVE